MQRVFFYGLFMDVDALTRESFAVQTVGPARLAGFELRIGDRATLLRSADAVSYGILVDMPVDDLRQLYSQPGLSDYCAEPVRLRLLADESGHAAQCYNLPANRLGDAVNVGYAHRLAELARALDLPVDYVAHIEALGMPRVPAPDAGSE